MRTETMTVYLARHSIDRVIAPKGLNSIPGRSRAPVKGPFQGPRSWAESHTWQVQGPFHGPRSWASWVLRRRPPSSMFFLYIP